MNLLRVLAVGTVVWGVASGAAAAEKRAPKLLEEPTPVVKMAKLVHESAKGVVTIGAIEQSPAALLATDFPRTASFRGVCGRPGTLQLVFDRYTLGRRTYRLTLYLCVSSGERVRKEKEVRVRKLDPADPAFSARAGVRVGDPFDVQWVFQSVDIPGEWKLRRIKFQAAPSDSLPVRTREQAIARIQTYERKLYRQMYGEEAETLPLASESEPHSVDETEEAFRIEYRQPFDERGGGYVKAFSVSKQTGEVSRVAWQLGR